MFSIGEFSKLSGVTVKALHHYNDLDLLRPAHIDSKTGYRFYRADQLAKINQILALKASGFPLKEIKSLFHHGAETRELTALMMEKLNGMEHEIEKQQVQAQHLRRQIFRMQNGGIIMEKVVVIKSVEPILVAYIRSVIKDYNEMLGLWEGLNHEIEKQRIKKALPCMTIYHNGWDTTKGMDISVVEPVTCSFKDSSCEGLVRVETLPGVSRMASIVHQGSFETIGSTYNIIEEWLSDHGEKLAGPVREIYHEGDWSKDNPNDYVTEIQFPLVS